MRVTRVAVCFLALVVVIAVGGCQKTYLVEAVGDPFEPIFQIEKPMFFFEDGSGLISVSQYDPQTNVSTQVWSAEYAHDAPTTSVNEIKYGEPPPGFGVLVKKKILKPGVIYVVHIDSGGGINAHGRFKILQEGAAAKLVNLDLRWQSRQRNTAE